MTSIAFLLLGILFGIFLLYIILKMRSPALLKLSADYSEADAEEILLKNGFEILEKRKAMPITLYIDSKSHLVSSGADYIAKKDGRKYAVKISDKADPDPKEFIELKNLFPGFGLIFLNLTLKELYEINIEFPKPEKEIVISILIALTVVSAIAAIIFLFGLLKLY